MTDGEKAAKKVSIILTNSVKSDLSGWHAADGSGNGNRRTIAIECIMSSAYSDRDKKSEDNAARLAAALLKKYNLSIDSAVFTLICRTPN